MHRTLTQNLNGKIGSFLHKVLGLIVLSGTATLSAENPLNAAPKLTPEPFHFPLFPESQASDASSTPKSSVPPDNFEPSFDPESFLGLETADSSEEIDTQMNPPTADEGSEENKPPKTPQETATTPPPATCLDRVYGKCGFKIEAGISYFYPKSEIFREIYGGGADFHFNLSQKIGKQVDLWAGVNYFNKDGHSLGFDQKTTITLIPTSLGLKYFLPPFCIYWVKVAPYLNGAFKYYYLEIHDQSDFVDRHTKKDGLGGVFGIGTYLHFKEHIFMNVLIDYSFKKFHAFHHEKPNIHNYAFDVSGFDFGVGLGFSF